MNRIVSCLLICLLIGAQTITFSHATEHEAELLQDSCSFCVGSGQLSSAVTDSGQVHFEQFVAPIPYCSDFHIPAIRFTAAPRQRGPPRKL